MKLLYLPALITLSLLASCDTPDDSTPARDAGNMLLQENQVGRSLFQAKCALCHHPVKDLTGPALAGALSRSPGKNWVYAFVQHPDSVIASGDTYAVALFNKWNRTAMTGFPELSHAEIDSIMSWCDEFPNKGSH